MCPHCDPSNKNLMTEQQQQNENENAIQSSAYVSSQSLLTASLIVDNAEAAFENDNFTNNSNNFSKKSSKSRLAEGDDCGGEGGHYGGTMERLFVID
jgi:hypothetical protein